MVYFSIIMVVYFSIIIYSHAARLGVSPLGCRKNLNLAADMLLTGCVGGFFCISLDLHYL